MNTYEVVDCLGVSRTIKADYFEYGESLRALFYIEPDPKEPLVLECAFINPASIVKMEGVTDE